MPPEEQESKIMKRYGKKIKIFLGSIMLFCCLSFIKVQASEADYTNSDIAEIMWGIVDWKKDDAGAGTKKLFASGFEKNAGNSAADWYAVGLGRMGCDEDYSAYLALVKYNVQIRYESDEKLDAQKATEWHRISLAVLSSGGNPTNMGKDNGGNVINLIKDGTYDRSKTMPLGIQGVNAYIWGLITLDSMRYEVPVNSEENRDDMISAILRSSLSEGSFSLDGSNSDIDITSMAIQALAPYYNSEQKYSYKTIDNKERTETVRSVIDRAIIWLSSKQSDEGDFAAWGQLNAESTAQVMVALCSIGIDPDNDSRFIKNGNSVLDGLIKYQNIDGGFAHSFISDDENSTAVVGESNSMAGEQALYALCSLYRYRTGLRNLYDFRKEQSDELKKQIKNLNYKCQGMLNDKDTVKVLFDEYLSIPETERCYVYSYYLLSEAMKKYNIKNTSPYLSACMDENTGGKGTVIDITSKQTMTSGLKFNKSDYEEYCMLPQELTGEYYTTVIRLYEKLTEAENINDYKEILNDLEVKKETVEAIINEVESINTLIAEKLYPYDKITSEDKEVVEELLKRTEKLSKYDRLQVLGYEDLLKAKAKIDTSLRSIFVWCVAVICVIVCLMTVAIRWKNRCKQKQDEMHEENEEW